MNIPSSKIKILFMGEAVTLAHVARPLALAQKLPTKLFDIHMAVDPRYQFLVSSDSNQSIYFHQIKSPSSSSFRQKVEAGKFPYNENEIISLVQDDLSLLEKIKPDIVIGDFRISLSISSKYKKIPYFSITNAHWLPDFYSHYPIPDLGALPYLPKFLVRSVQKCVFRYAAYAFKAAAQHFGIKNFSPSLTSAYTDGDRILVPDHPSARINKLEKELFIGPIFWEPKLNLPSWWASFKEETKPVVYINLGSSGPQLNLNKITDQLLKQDLSVVISQIQPTNPFIEKKHLYVGEYLPSGEVLKKSSLFIGNGGSMSTQMALAEACPVLALPANYDQQLYMEQITALKLAKIINKRNRVEEVILKHSLELLSQSEYKKQLLKHQIKFKPNENKTSLITSEIKKVLGISK
ncbi:MAG: hypothetical protein K1X29_00340 [Bdellovibrionales bacterium]|nr:hypothetical protein [Bdellovibrionales bacterium]